LGPERTAQRATVLLERAGIRSAAGGDLDAAERDVVEAMDLISRSPANPQGAPIDPRMAQAAIAALISVKPELQGPRGLAMSDGLRELVGAAAGETPVLPTVDQLEALAAALPPERAAVVFLFDIDSLLTWVIGGGTIRFVDRPMSRREIESRVAALSVQIARSVNEEIWVETLADLHDLLLRDLPGIANARDLLIVADGPLSRVPFGSLVDRRSGTFLFERTAIRLAPSLSFGLRSAAAPSNDVSVLSIGAPQLVDDARSGLPPLPRAQEEAVLVAALYPRARTLIGSSATKARVLGELPTADVIHFAGHAVVNSGSAPRLLLAGSIADPSTGLSVGDLTGRLHGSRVVLAGCETATASATDRSTSRTHLASAFLRAGASSVVGSLWKVDDAVAEEFFTGVHRRLAEGQSAAVAVAGAQRECRASGDCRQHPATWVGATVYGMQ
jgi:CHAT domain-containing protein